MKTRFGVAPAGLLSVAAARIALANCLHARRHGGTFVLRIDDTERAGAEAEEAIRHDLEWLGVTWDEHVRQSERLERYAAAAARLQASGRLYPCFESEEELNAKRELRLKRGLSPVYDRAMLKLTREQRTNAEAGGKRPYWRFLLSGRTVSWTDLVLGPRFVKLPTLSDPVMIRADGTPVQAFAAVVDDLEDGITDLVLGEEHLSQTGVALDLAEALAPGRAAMRLGHLPALTDAEGGKLRPGAVTLRGLRGDGIEAAALAGYLARLGTGLEPVPGTPETLAPEFRLAGRREARFDGRELLPLNRRALRDLPFEAVHDRLPPAATPAFWSAVRGKLDLLNEARGWWDVVAGSIVPPLLAEESDYLHAALDALPPEPWDNDVWRRWIDRLKAETGRKGPRLFMPLRQALTGEDAGPDLRDLLPLMGRLRVAERLRLAAA